MEKRPPLSRIAEAVGVSKMTVSRALREGTSVAPQLRAKIREAAERLGYRSDLRISAVMSAIRRSEAPIYRENLAFIWTHRGGRGRDGFFAAEFAAAKRQAEAQGYQLEEFRLKTESLNGRMLTRILHSRGIRGVLIAPPSFERTHPHIWLEWDRFCSVFIGRSMANTGVARVQHDHYSGAMLAVRNLRRLQYRRIGLVISRSMDERSTRLVRAAFLNFHPTPLTDAVKLIFTADRHDAQKFMSWLEKTRPDVILANFEEVFPKMEQIRDAVAGRAGLATLNWSSEHPWIAGVNQQRATIGEQAVDLLVNRLQSHRVGLDPLAPSILIPGLWMDGSSVRLG